MAQSAYHRHTNTLTKSTLKKSQKNIQTIIYFLFADYYPQQQENLKT